MLATAILLHVASNIETLIHIIRHAFCLVTALVIPLIPGWFGPHQLKQIRRRVHLTTSLATLFCIKGTPSILDHLLYMICSEKHPILNKAWSVLGPISLNRDVPERMACQLNSEAHLRAKIRRISRKLLADFLDDFDGSRAVRLLLPVLGTANVSFQMLCCQVLPLTVLCFPFPFPLRAEKIGLI